MTKLKHVFAFLALLLLALTAGAQNEARYADLWKQVDSLDAKYLYKSGLEKASLINNLAYADQNLGQFVKSAMYMMRYERDLGDMTLPVLIKQKEQQADTAVFPMNAVLHAMTAKLYRMYYIQEQWRINDRSATVNYDPDDIATWDIKRLAWKMIWHEWKALENPEELLKIDISTLDLVLVNGHEKKYRPTLFDLLAHEAISFFATTQLSAPAPINKFVAKEDYWFEPARKFVSMQLAPDDSLSFQLQAVKVWQLLIKQTLNRDNSDLLASNELLRLDYMLRISVNQQKDTLHLLAIENIANQYKTSPLASEAIYRIAQYYSRRSDSYNPFDPYTAYLKNYKLTARRYCRQAMKQYPNTYGAQLCECLIYQLEYKNLNFSVENIVPVSSPYAVKIDYRNIDTAYIQVLALEKEKYYRYSNKSKTSEDFIEKIKRNGKELFRTTLTLPSDSDLNAHSFDYVLQGLPSGHYVVLVSGSPRFVFKKNMLAYGAFQVSNLGYFSRYQQGKGIDLYVVNRQTGKAIAGAGIEAYYYKYSYATHSYRKVTIGTYTSDSEGYVLVPENYEIGSSVYCTIKLGAEEVSTESYYFNSPYNDPGNTVVHLFADRAIYRPGQTIFFKGIVVRTQNDKPELVPAVEHTVELYDPNGQQIGTTKVTSNEFGSYSGSFVIPTGLLTGQYYLRVNYNYLYFSVEEYKRPNFLVSMLPFEGNYRLEDSVKVSGEAVTYAGSKLTGASVSYRITRASTYRYWYGYYPNTDAQEIAFGTVETDANGKFEIPFKAIPDYTRMGSDNPVFVYTITADVTDINGETQSTSSSLTIGKKALVLSVNLSDQVNKAAPGHALINAQNLNGQPVAAKGTVKIFKLKSPATPLRARLWARPDKTFYSADQWATLYPHNEFTSSALSDLPVEKEIFSASFDTDLSSEFTPDFAKMPQGQYMTELTSVDAFGSPVVSRSWFTLFDPAEKSTPYPATNWFKLLTATCEPGDTAKLLIGSAYQDVRILFEVEHKNAIIRKEWLTLNNEQRVITVPVTEDFRGNFSVHADFFIDNRHYSFSQLIIVPFSNKDLDVSFTSFRDKLQPGEEEEWTITVKGPEGERVVAEMLATLYDASLEKFRPHYWGFSLYPSYSTNLAWNVCPTTYQGGSSLRGEFDKYCSYSGRDFPTLNWFGLTYYGYDNYFYFEDEMLDGPVFSVSANGNTKNGKAKLYMKTTALPSSVGGFAEDRKAVVVQEEAGATEGEISEVASDDDESGGDSQEEPVQIRSNFAETAFFYPHLQTNAEGEIIVKFTIPEALTKWRMKGIAHTKDLKTGYIENSLVTQKELMVMPYAPRFFRQGDAMEFPLKISNLSGKSLKGTVSLEFFDPITEAPVNVFAKGQADHLSFSVDSGLNTSLQWQIEIPKDAGMLGYRVIARADKFSDGEQKAIPVLSDRMLVTESMPLAVRGGKSKSYTFDKLLKSGDSKTLTHHALTLEYCSNPAWYALQSLPYLMEYPYECLEQTFSRFYANAISLHIVNSDPKIKQVYDQWKNAPDSSAFLSNLQKNEELKAVTLEETPWVWDALNESQRKKNIAYLFEAARMEKEMEAALKKIEQNQTINGGWPWFRGMPESPYITQHIVCGMGHLRKLGVLEEYSDSRLWRVLKRAVQFTDNTALEHYRWLKRNYDEEEMKQNRLYYSDIHYLYGRSFFPEVNMNAKEKEAYDYFMGQAMKYWGVQSQYMQGLIALSLHRADTAHVAGDIMKSLKERAAYSEELGMYWKYNAGYYWYEAPIETQALMIEAFSEVAKDSATVDELKIWLLKQKQTQNWETTRATVEAVYALLMTGGQWLTSDKLVNITMGNKTIDPTKMENVDIEPGTGYFKVKWSEEEVNPQMGKVKVENPNPVVSWGSVYWQYFEQLDKITPHETPLKLRKELFVERNTNAGPVIEPINKRDKLNIGDKIIVRIELRSDREMEYLHMKDMRASGFEPINVLSMYKYQDGLGYYESTRDAATHFFIERLPKGTFVFEYPLRVTHKGDFSNGITTIQCMYAPEFTSHSEGVRVKVE